MLNVTTLFKAVVPSKPAPLITMVFEVRERLAELTVTPGTTVATCTPVRPLASPLVVTMAVRLPAVVSGDEIGTVNVVAVAAVAVTGPSPKSTVLFAAVVSKPKPLITIEVALAARFAVLLVIIGLTVAT